MISLTNKPSHPPTSKLNALYLIKKIKTWLFYQICNMPNAYNPQFTSSLLISLIRSDNPMIEVSPPSKKDKTLLINNKHNKAVHRLPP